MTYIMIPPIILTILISSEVNASMSIANSGVRSIGRLDAGMIFFVELVNEGKQEIAVSSRMIGCCEIVTIEDIECEHIQLIGEVVTVESQGIKNVTLIWPTLYLHDRRGECAVSISVESGHDVEETRRKIRFNTMVTGSNPNVLEEYYDAVDVRQCSSPDQDTLDACHPVNCQIKYNGQRNYFDRQLQRCQSVPVCLADPNKELPDVVYDAINNTCRNMENLVTQEEIQSLSGGAAEVAWRSESKPKIRNILCHHGHNDKQTGLCICDEGWTSQPLGNLEPINEYIHMCNVFVLPFPGLGNSPIHILLIVIAAVLIVLIVVFYCITTLLMGVLPEKVKIERSQQTVGLPCFDGPSKSLTSCCSTRPVSRKQGSNASNITYSRLSNRSLHSTKP
ncbi:uncharacterized protein LOC107045110 [Diachasma alloeum]|uniref:uncharacterized protein LOC107045110 n=1 Tax=Diachasma alloeum TaxID=454923 RepID=UPI0007384FFD|nr:uncharacterized protein LOC107045110 [Diachasma alloeum]